MTQQVTKYIVVGGLAAGLLSLIVGSDAKVSSYNHAANVDANEPIVTIDTPQTKAGETTSNLHYDFKDKSTGDPLNYPNSGGLMLNNPSNVNTSVDYDPTTGNYDINQKMGGNNFRPPTYMDAEEYQNYMFKKQVKKYWNARSESETQTNKNKPIIPKLNVGGEIFDRIFGGNTVDIRPNGSAELIFAYNGTKTDNPAIPVLNRKVNTFDFNERIQLNVVGKIGDKLKLTTSYNTEATFDFENQMKLEYAGYEDDIIKKIEAGNVSMPLTGSLITGSQTLFGVKTQLQFGRLTFTGVVSQQKGKKSEVEVTGGAQISKFEVAGDAYEANKHFFLAQYFRDHFNSALSSLPFVNSEVNIDRIEIWISNTNTSTTDIRSIVAFSELAEDGANGHIPADQIYIHDTDPSTLPFNGQNDLYSHFAPDSVVRTINTTVSRIGSLTGNTMKQTVNYELVASARKLQPTEYTLNAKLGYISLNQQLNPDQAVSVAYQYTINGHVYQVGEFADGGISAPKALFTKMLKSTATNTRHPMWDLMMKNIYSLGAFQITQKDFKLNVLYNNLQTGTDINYLPVGASETKIHGKTLLQVLSLDRLNQQNDQVADGVFDFIDGVTINANNGRVIFPVVQPFGDYLRLQFNPTNPVAVANSYVFDQLYDSTKIIAQQFPQLNRFKLKGTYSSSSSSDISLGAPNVPQGSVTVTAGGVKLTENVDYTVDYTLGRVKIINDGILNSGTPIKIALESNALFAIQQKTLLASHFDYRINKDFNVGATIMNLTERPLTHKVNIGDEPISNTIWGLDGNYRTEAPFLTRFVDHIPLIHTKEMSTITAAGEYAYLIPGHSKAIGTGAAANSYIDDFEGSQSTIDLRSQSSWTLASTPQGQTGLFPEGNLTDSLPFGYNRAKLAWYVIDPLFLRQTTGLTPGNITDADMSNNFAREVPETEVFPNKPVPNGLPPNIATLDMSYYPNERGPYNYDATPVPGISSGLDANGNLKDPQTRWGGIMRSIQTNDFEAANVEYIQFWVMDPFNSDNANPSTTGDLYFNIGNVSEDILRDNYKSAENGLPTPAHSAATVSTAWGLVPAVQPLLNTFNNDPAERPFQDVGLDGLSTTTIAGATYPTEQSFFSDYLSKAHGIVSPAAYNTINADPSNDDFHYFRGSDYDGANIKTVERYKKYNGMENNSRTTEQSPESYPTSATLTPNVEDINRDNNLSTAESYFQYHISLKPNDFTSGVGTNYITNVFSTPGQNIKNGTVKPIKWYQFKVPIKAPEGKVGSIDNFQSIRFIRMFFKNVDKPITLRFARLELVRSEWRKYGFDLLQPGIYIPNDDASTLFDVSAVSIEVDGSKLPVNYVLPPNINREINAATANLIALNEQSMSLTVCNLQDGQSRAAFKNTSLDVRSYKKLLMYIHAEASPNTNEILHNNDLHAFVRLGTDYSDNYYEYDIPLQVTAPGNYNGTNIDDQYRVWPEANEMVLEFAKLQAAKQQRNGTGANITTEYSVMDGTRKITVKGNPNLSAIKTLMIGIRNPKIKALGDGDDGLSKCAQVWVDELRLSDFDETGGGAATGRVTAKLADFGTMSLSGNWYSPGFGSIEDKVSGRKKETLLQYDITSSFELGKFLPQNVKIHIPMFVGYSESFITPQYDPLNPDILLKQELKDPSLSQAYRDSLKLQTVDYTKRRSLNFINVKKEKGKNAKKSHIYDIENWAASYSYTEIYKRNINLLYDSTRNYKGGVIYSYSPTPKNIRPFGKTKILSSKYLLLVKDINFYLFPNKLGFSTDVSRGYNTQEVRNTTAGDMIMIPSFNKQFTMIRNYDLKYDITKALKLDFIATNDSRVLEPFGAIDTREKKDTLWNNFYQGGKTTSYNQQLNVNYAVPINKLPLLDFTSASVRYTGTYNWLRAPFHADSLGNTIQNSAAMQFTGQMNMVTLYNKIPYFKKINQNANKKPIKKVVPPLKDKDGKPIQYTKAQNDSIKKANAQPSIVLEYIARVIMSLKNVNATYSTNEGTILPGYSHFTNAMGMDKNFDGPTPGFIFGDQKDIRDLAASRGWLDSTRSLNTPYVHTNSQNLNVRATIEPIPDLKIELTALRTNSLSHSEFYKWKVNDTMRDGSIVNHFARESPIETGNFSMSFLSFSTSFKNGDDVFQSFLDDRSVISNRLGAQNDSSRTKQALAGYAVGYNATSQDVLIPAFIAAYSGKLPQNVAIGKAGTLPAIPKPNWRITYDGLSKIDAVKKYFKSVTLSHAYRSTYNVSSYASNLLFDPYNLNGEFTGTKEPVSSIANNPNFLSQNLINTITVSEQWSPLIKVDMTLNNSVLANFEYKKDRNLSLGLTSKTITEVAGSEIVVGTGYRLKNLSLGKKLLIKGKPIKSDLNLKCDLSFRKNQTVIRRIVEEVSQITAGSNIVSIKVSADYVINERINIRLFYDRIINNPVISNSFPTTNTNAGLSLRLSLSN